MALEKVLMPSDVYFVCVNHALSTEGEEIVGLFVGEINSEKVAHISAVLILRRSDKRKDRVEISPEQLSNASTEAERLAHILKRQVRIVGWYHSHPKLTVWPSLIDVNTQDSYQLMDDGFIGIIFSVFNEDPTRKGGRIQMTCYQSQTVIEDGNIEKKRLDIPVDIVPTKFISNVSMNTLIQLPRFLCQEEQLAYQVTNQTKLDYLTRLHNSSIYLRSMGQIAEVICAPLLKMLEERIANNEMRRKKLQGKKEELAMVLEQLYIEARAYPASDENSLPTKSFQVATPFERLEQKKQLTDDHSYATALKETDISSVSKDLDDSIIASLGSLNVCDFSNVNVPVHHGEGDDPSSSLTAKKDFKECNVEK
ncbi:lys-63-specific deubiquitinase BRCC36-like [Uloborus diversus]|uniref:lys-63-specific deubiquitinase BRCC36-like n=1 Tax=Uloborus diversus TaxID=327109 RepID=UPI00240A5FC5|nr:lys-63-specific deubiquitinase BRCC36-like [Uloborus diversus]